MSLFKLWAQGVDVSRLTAQLDTRPELWNANDYRTQAETSVHRGVSDIWVRWRAEAELISPEAFNEPHVSMFWPAWYALPALSNFVFDAARLVRATQVGGILITRTPGGGRVMPHVDGGWHAGFYGTKLYLVMRSNPRCIIHCAGEPFHPRSGDLLEYPNNVIHGVVNDGDTEHVNMIMCFRTEG